jgi:hypothetical protein
MTGRELFELRSTGRLCWSELDELMREAWERSANPTPAETLAEVEMLERAFIASKRRREEREGFRGRTPEQVTIEVIHALAGHVERLSGEVATLRQRLDELETRRS